MATIVRDIPSFDILNPTDIVAPTLAVREKIFYSRFDRPLRRKRASPLFFEKNCQALAQNAHNQPIIQQLASITPETEGLLAETASGDYSLIYQGIPLHDLEGATAEADRVCEKHCRPSNKAHHLIFGMGLGYLLQGVFERSVGRICVYEPNLPLLRFILENVDISEYLGSPRVFLCLTPEALLTHLEWRYNLGDSVDILVLDGHMRLMSDHLPGLIQNDVLKLVKLKKAAAGTIFAYHQNWNEQFYRNLPYLPKAQIFTPLNNRFANKPALILSAGPSLDSSYEWIRSVQDKMVLIAVGSALRALINNDIIPDFACFMEFGGCQQQLHGLGNNTQNISFLLSPFAETACFTQPAKHRFQLNLANYSELSLWVEKMLGTNQPEFPSGGTVSLMGMRAGIAMGCNPIILVGQDLAFKNKQFYAGGVEAKFEDGCVVMDDSDENLAKRVTLTEVKGWNGETLSTGVDYAFYIKEFEEAARRNARSEKPLQLFNASVGGAYIDGFEHAPLNDIANRLNLTPLDKSMDDLTLTQEVIDKRYAAIREEVNQLATGMSTCRDLARTAYFNLNCLLKGTVEAGTSYSKRYQHAHDEFNKRFTRNELLMYALQRQLIDLYRLTDTNDDSEEALMNILNQQLPYYQNAGNTLDELLKILTPVKDEMNGKKKAPATT